MFMTPKGVQISMTITPARSKKVPISALPKPTIAADKQERAKAKQEAAFHSCLHLTWITITPEGYYLD